jgi:hypothetical protein
VEVLVAVVLVAAVLLPAGQAVAAAIRLGRRGDAVASVSLSLMARASLIQQEAGSTAPRCLGVASGSEVDAAVAEWWTVTDSGSVRRVSLHSRALRAGWPVEDSVEIRVRCQ